MGSIYDYREAKLEGTGHWALGMGHGAWGRNLSPQTPHTPHSQSPVPSS
ncbi:hypothetical protein H6H03_23895 [Nostoc paludosum FACHB-159]|uniref:Uncharacterized protein n=1 Tax=Nostoc paludosum FACHB-159 TaxID=2692908 RepID=A0ABR8KBI2_9NOSO|nr:hypothetical protein [Nostoc paludosum FACHB-159]